MFIEKSSISEFSSHFFEWGKSRNRPKSKNDVTQTNFNCKAVEDTEVIEKVRVKRNKNLLDEVKKLGAQ